MYNLNALPIISFYLGTDFIEIPFEQWTYSHFSKLNQTLLDYIKVKDYLCPKNTDFYLQGNYFSNQLRFIELIVSKWNETNSNGVQCKSKTDIDSYLNNMSLFIFATSAIFDFNDYNDPIKYYINDRFYYQFISSKLDLLIKLI